MLTRLRIKNFNRFPDADIDPEAAETLVAFLPPMSGLTATEPKWEAGRINVLLGEGQTAQVLRKTAYHALASLVPADKIDPEVTEKLNGILAVASKATPKVV